MADIDLSQHHILLADDVLFARATVKKILSSFDRPNVIEAVNGQEAIDIINGKNCSVTMIIADFNMPKMNGLEVLKLIRTGRTQLARDFPVAMLTGYSEQHLVDMALALDVNAFLIKPVSRDAMGARLTKLLEMSPDKNWLKPVATYEAIEVVSADDPRNPADVPTSDQSDPIIKPARPAPKRPISRLSGKFSDAELAPSSSDGSHSEGRRFEDPDLAARDVMGRLSSLMDRIENPNSAKEVALEFQRLVAKGDSGVAKRVITALDTFERRGAISVDDIGRVFDRSSGDIGKVETSSGARPTQPPSEPEITEVFTSLEDVPEDAVLARSLYTEDGSLLLQDGTVLTSQLLEVLKRMDALDLLLLEAIADDTGEGRGIFVEKPDGKPIPTDNLKAVPLHKVPDNTVLAKDVYLDDGRLYMTAGTVLTPRLLSLLQDLVDLDRFIGEVWIAE